jgi:hypothetical protein
MYIYNKDESLNIAQPIAHDFLLAGRRRGIKFSYFQNKMKKGPDCRLSTTLSASEEREWLIMQQIPL